MHDLNKPAGVLVKTTMVDFPGHIATAIFLKGCNLRCPYCYNTGLVLNNEPEENLASVNDLFQHLEKRKNVISAIAISGGEPLVNPYLKDIIQKAKSMNMLVKMDTNGMLPDRLETLINDENLRPDFIAMDIKTSPDRYAETMLPVSIPSEKKIMADALTRSAKLIAENYSTSNREYRTVLVPGLVTKEDIKSIAEILPEDASWQFAGFRNKNCLNPEYNKIVPYLDRDLSELVEYAKTLIPCAALR